MSTSSHSQYSPVLWPIDWSLPKGVHALCTTRLGGVSKPPFQGLNLGDHVRDDPIAVATNRALLQEQLGGARPVFLTQVHGEDVIEINASTPDGTQADASITQSPLVACTIMVADCLPLLLTDDKGQMVAAIHAGWRGLATGVVEQTVNALRTRFGVTPPQLRVWLGPCIGPEAFEVGEDVRLAFTSDVTLQNLKIYSYFKPHPHHLGKWLADLAGLARCRLNALGVAEIVGNDSQPDWCTVSQSSRFFSFRRDGSTGRFAVCIWRS